MSILDNLDNPDYELADTHDLETVESIHPTTFAIRICRHDLFDPDEPTHRKVMSMFCDDEYRFFRVVGRLAATMAEAGYSTPPEIRQKVEYAIRTMLLHLPSQMAGVHVGCELINPHTLALCHQHVERCATAMMRYVPTGIWKEIVPVLIQDNQLYLSGAMYVGDHH